MGNNRDKGQDIGEKQTKTHDSKIVESEKHTVKKTEK